jgi:hypothetical protein
MGSDGGTNKNTATGGNNSGHAVFVGGGKKRNSAARTPEDLCASEDPDGAGLPQDPY